ncbi:unnamed protein product [Schistocephalus solidus]|uniref:Uncharacterized protein n=1 Tax=Schistocephalus solidus TaxID=70667 RepID=A0A3P7B8P6_SCHSO|nr:unnamed protein product [Schistocephalus solidus]
MQEFIMHNSESSTPLLSSSSNTITIKSSGFRWMVLLGLSAQNTLSGILWIALAPVANHAISYYCMTAYSLNAINLIFPFTTVLVGLFTAASIDIFGVRYVLGTGILCNLTCAFLRLTSTWMTKSSSRFALLIVAQIIASIAQPFCLFAPTKLALVWFPDTQRTTATTLASLANSFGVLIGSAYPPLLVKQPSDIPSLEASIFGIAVFVALLTLPAFWRGNRFLAFHTWIVLKNRGFLLLAFGFATGLAYFTTVSALFQQMLCSTGYSNEFAGLCGALMIGGGIFVAFLVSIIVGKTGSILYGIKVVFYSLGAIGFSVTIQFPGRAMLIAFFVLWFGGFGFSIYGLSLEMAAEATYPVPEMVTTGFMLMLSQLLSIISIMLMQVFAPVIRDSRLQTCGPDALVKVSHIQLQLQWFSQFVA